MARGNAVPDAYDGREQAFIKHELLKSYLLKLFTIVGSTARRIELCYVDCFAGPWGDDSESMETTSIAISLQTLDSVRQKLEKLGIKARVRALYVEKDARAHARLVSYLAGYTPAGIESTPMHGDFVSLREQILKAIGPDAFTFFFIDPKGWTGVEVGTLRPLLARPRSEFLITFMYDFVNRVMSMHEWQSEMADLVGEPINLDDLNSKQREDRILRTYRANLKRHVVTDSRFPARSAYVRVLDPNRQRPKYHLVYITSHPRGIVEFMTISETVDIVQKVVRADLKDAERERRSGISEMFPSLIDATEGHASGQDVDQFWRDFIGGNIRAIDRDAFADIIEEKNWFPGDLQASLARLIASGEAINLDAPGKRPKSPLHFSNSKAGERLQLTRSST